MIKIENTEVMGWEHAIRGMRNPLNSWDKIDSHDCPCHDGLEHAKYRRMIVFYADVTAPLYWWKEYDTYKVGTVANSCRTMHKIHSKQFDLADFSHEHLTFSSTIALQEVIYNLNYWRAQYELADTDKVRKESWWQLIQMLPSSYNQRRTLMLNYEVLANIYKQRENHKLDEWRQFCSWASSLPYSELITGKV
uniref:Uncharacterized protein n=1 Tax=Ackermannviridae sp. TaxID=2831612 RepID=A0A8S5VX87_9CAUD|nr:MAG TPA: hypothetical protein [Ackermannviridae sp.]